jgi:hypothetical protein
VRERRRKERNPLDNVSRVLVGGIAVPDRDDVFLVANRDNDAADLLSHIELTPNRCEDLRVVRMHQTDDRRPYKLLPELVGESFLHSNDPFPTLLVGIILRKQVRSCRQEDLG